MGLWAGIAALMIVAAARQGILAPIPPMLAAEPKSNSEILLVWRFEPGYRFARIEVSFKGAGTPYRVVGEIDGHSNTFLKSGLQPDSRYYFRARACVGRLCSNYSNEVVATPL